MTYDDDIPPGTATEEAAAWFARHQSGRMTAADRRAFGVWRAGDPTRAAAFDRLARLWEAPGFAQSLARHASTTMPAPARPPVLRRAALALAAMLVLAVGLGALTDVLPLRPADHATATGARQQVTLPDGSVMTLNSGSAVDVAFAPGTRRLELIRGEAFFDVRPDAARPFEVVAGRSVTRVLGTAFSVALFDGGADIRVQRGRVRVSGDGGGSVDLTPGTGVTVASGRVAAPRALPEGEAFAWLDGRFVFTDLPLADVIGRLGRHHRGMVLLASDRLRGLRVSGNYRLDDPGAVVTALAAVVDAEVTRISPFLTVLH